jgi:hypothetical protein
MLKWSRQLKLDSLKKALFGFAFGGLLMSSTLTPSNADVGVDYRGAWVDKHIGAKEDTQIREDDEGIQAVYTFRGSDGHIFDDPTLFRALKHASLCVTEHNAENLNSLAANYPNIESLTLRQPIMLRKEEIAVFKSFRKLRLLELDCTVASPGDLLNILTPTIEQIELVNSNAFECTTPLRLPQLTELRVMHSKLHKDFLKELEAPKLKRIFIHSVQLEPNTLSSLSKFRNLREVNVAGSILSKADIDTITALKVRLVTPENELVRKTGVW